MLLAEATTQVNRSRAVQPSDSRPVKRFKGSVALALTITLAWAGLMAAESNAAFPGLNGRIVVGEHNGGLLSISPRGGSVERLTKAGIGPAVSPDGREVVYYRGASRGASELWKLDLSTGERSRLTDTKASEGSPTFSPSGDQIAYVRYGYSKRDYSSIWVMNSDGSGQYPVTPRNDFATNPSWSPDGGTIAFVGRIDKGSRYTRSEIFVVDPDGTHEERLTFSGSSSAGYPDFAPDGDRIAFVHHPAGCVCSSIATITANGKRKRFLTDRSLGYIGPSYSPNGRRIVALRLSVNGNGTARLVVMQRNGARGRVISPKSLRPGIPDWGAKP